MRKLTIIFFILLITGCVHISECNYPLTEKGWKPTGNPPEKLIYKFKYDINAKWFTNDNGDYMSCTEMVGEHHCGNVYHQFLLKSNGEYENVEIICLT